MQPAVQRGAHEAAEGTSRIAARRPDALDVPMPWWRRAQRDLVVASLLACDREDRPVHRRWA